MIDSRKEKKNPYNFNSVYFIYLKNYMYLFILFFTNIIYVNLYNTVIISRLTKSNSETQTEYYNVKSVGNTTSSRTLVLAVDQRKPGAAMTLYVNCEHFGVLHTTKTLREVYFDMKDPHLQMVSNSKKKKPSNLGIHFIKIQIPKLSLNKTLTKTVFQLVAVFSLSIVLISFYEIIKVY